MDNNPQEKSFLLKEDIQRTNHPTWFGYPRRTILLILTLILLVITFEASLALVHNHKFHKRGSSTYLARAVPDDSLAGASSVNSGQMTYFEPDLGSCGMHNTGSQMVCAISHGLYGTPPLILLAS